MFSSLFPDFYSVLALLNNILLCTGIAQQIEPKRHLISQSDGGWYQLFQWKVQKSAISRHQVKMLFQFLVSNRNWFVGLHMTFKSLHSLEIILWSLFINIHVQSCIYVCTCTDIYFYTHVQTKIYLCLPMVWHFASRSILSQIDDQIGQFSDFSWFKTLYFLSLHIDFSGMSEILIWKRCGVTSSTHPDVRSQHKSVSGIHDVPEGVLGKVGRFDAQTLWKLPCVSTYLCCLVGANLQEYRFLRWLQEQAFGWLKENILSKTHRILSGLKADEKLDLLH